MCVRFVCDLCLMFACVCLYVGQIYVSVVLGCASDVCSVCVRMICALCRILVLGTVCCNSMWSLCRACVKTSMYVLCRSVWGVFLWSYMSCYVCVSILVYQ